MDAGGLAQMSHNNFTSPNGLGMPMSGLASRRGGANVKPLSMEALKAPGENDTGVPTPRTSRSHLLAGLRTAPKSATAATFPTSAAAAPSAQQMLGRPGGVGPGVYTNAQDSMYNNGPKTSLPRYGAPQQQQQQQQPGYGGLMGMSNLYTAEQILAPPEIHIDEHVHEQMDPSLYSQLVATNMYLAHQQQRLQQQLLNVQAAAQQFQGLNLNGMINQQQQQQFGMQSMGQNMGLQNAYQQQQQHQQHQHRQQQQQQHQLASLPPLITTSMAASPSIYAYIDPMTGQQTYFLDQSQLNSPYADQTPLSQHTYSPMQPHQHQHLPMPRLQVSPPPDNQNSLGFRANSPPRKVEMPVEPIPLPPPSANAFRRGHKKCASLAISNNSLPASGMEPPKSAGPKSTSFPLSPLTTGGYMPGQARAGEHPVRQPRGPPAMDELRAKPTAKHEGSKNFAARTRRSAVHNLVRAGLERRKGFGHGSGSSSGSMSPVSESAEEADTPLTDNESDSGRSGSGSLSGDVDFASNQTASSRTSASGGGWGAIGSDRPSQQPQSFASVFKNGGPHRVGAPKSGAEGEAQQRKTAMLVLTSAEKRKSGSGIMVA